MLPKELEDGESFPVRRHQIDTNEHVNNCQYIQMAIDVVPECERAGQIRVEYKKSAVMGDIIYPKMAVEEQRKIVELCDAEGKSVCGSRIQGEIRDGIRKKTDAYGSKGS